MKNFEFYLTWCCSSWLDLGENKVERSFLRECPEKTDTLSACDPFLYTLLFLTFHTWLLWPSLALVIYMLAHVLTLRCQWLRAHVWRMVSTASHTVPGRVQVGRECLPLVSLARCVRALLHAVSLTLFHSWACSLIRYCLSFIRVRGLRAVFNKLQRF